jgi:hypothetical protein
VSVKGVCERKSKSVSESERECESERLMFESESI